MRLDEVDHQIITLLITDARASYAEIGAQVSLSAPAVKRRVERLRSSGVIKGFTAIVDPAAVGWTVEAFVELCCTNQSTPTQLATTAREHQAIVAAYTVCGDADTLVHIRAAGMEHLEQALDRLRAEPFVISTRSRIVLSRLLDESPPPPVPHGVSGPGSGAASARHHRSTLGRRRGPRQLTVRTST